MTKLTGDQIEELTCICNDLWSHMKALRNGHFKPEHMPKKSDAQATQEAYDRMEKLLLQE